MSASSHGFFPPFISDYSNPSESTDTQKFAFDVKIFQESNFPKILNRNLNFFQNDTDQNFYTQSSSFNPFIENIYEISENQPLHESKIQIIDESPCSSSLSSSHSVSDFLDDQRFEEEEKKTKILEFSHFSETYVDNTYNYQQNLDIDPQSPFSIEDNFSDLQNDNLNQTNSEEASQIHREFSHVIISDFLPINLELPSSDDNIDFQLYDEAHLTSTSDLDIQVSVSETENSHQNHSRPKETKPAARFSPILLKPANQSHKKQIPASHSPLTFETMPLSPSLHGLRRPNLISSPNMKILNAQQQIDAEIMNALKPSLRSKPDLTKNVSENRSPVPSKEQPDAPKVPLTNCCVAAAMGGNFRPLFTDFNHKERPKLHWVSFPGFSLSPFDHPPSNVEEYLLKQKKKQESGPNAVENEAIAINFCEICKSKFVDAASHRASELHKQRAALCNWKDIDDLFHDMNEKFVKELDDDS